MTAGDQHHVVAGLVVRPGAGRQRARATTLAAAVLLATLALLGRTAPAAAQSTTAPVHCRLGVYLLALHDFDYASRTFAADFWLWSVCPAATPQPLATMEFINANSITVSLPSTQPTADGVWSQRKIRGTFRYPWNLTTYPFDRHILPIILEEGVADTRTFVYDADTVNSGMGPGLVPSPWRVSGFALAAGTVAYDTTFGDPTLAPGGGSSYTRLTLTVTLARHDVTSFVKLTFVVYIAFLLSLVGFFLNMQSAAMFTARLGIISGALFAVAVNLRTVTTGLASEDRLTLVDLIHAVALVALLVNAVVAVGTQVLVERERPRAVLTRLDRIVLVAVVVGFAAANAWLIGRAIV